LNIDIFSKQQHKRLKEQCPFTYVAFSIAAQFEKATTACMEFSMMARNQ